MSSQSVQTTKPRPPLWRRILVLVLLAIAGGIVGYGVADLTREMTGGFSWSDHLALVLSVALLATAAIVTVNSMNRRALGRMLNMEGEATGSEVADARRQAAVTGLAGVMLFIPVGAALIGDESPALTYVIILGLFVIQSALNAMLWFRGDELVRRLMIEAGAVSFWGLQGVLFLYAAAERLALVPAITAWDAVTVLLATYLIVSCVVAARRCRLT